MKDNFNLKKFLKENKSIEKSNPFLNESYDEFQRDDEGSKGVTAKNTGEEDAYGAGFEAGENKDIKSSLREKIREMVIAELEDTSLEEAKEEVEDEEVEVETEEEVEVEDGEEEEIDVTDEETTTEEGEFDAPEMEGDEGEVLSHLMKALGIAKSMDNEKLIQQLGNTVTFLTRQYISGE
tara:strand:- start:841 stop:1380 length:540 start_codon:yes stop_codon:yes gene_type:complete